MQMKVFLAALAFSATPAFALEAPRAAPETGAQVKLSFAPVVKRALPAVVNVFASRVERRPQNPLFDDPVFRRFFGVENGPRTAQSLGSGVIVDASGLVVTNNHVIDGMTEVKIALSDKREFEAEIVLRDPKADLAVLKLKGKAPFPTLELGDSEGLEVGDLVLAIGNPFGVGQTVTQGIVSALARTQTGISDSGFFIQTDAAINPGNSGGALIDMQARLVGVNSAIFTQTGSSVGIGFAIPANTVRSAIEAARNGGHVVRRPWLGASLQNVSKEIAESLSLERANGAIVSEVFDSSPASEAGLKRGDIILAVDGKAIDDAEGFGYRFGAKPIGGQAVLNVLRNGRAASVSLRLAPAPEIPARDTRKITGASPFAGATVSNLSPAVAEELSLANFREGVVVTDVEEGANAALISLQKGDVVLAVGDARIATTRDLERAAAARRPFWKLTIGRGGEVITSVVGG